MAESSAKSVFQYCVLCQVCFVIEWQSILPSLFRNSVTEYSAKSVLYCKAEYSAKSVLYQCGRVLCQVCSVLVWQSALSSLSSNTVYVYSAKSVSYLYGRVCCQVCLSF